MNNARHTLNASRHNDTRSSMCRWTRTRPQPSEWHHRPIKIARGSDGRHAEGEKNTRHLTFPISPAVATRSDDRVRSRQMPKLRAATLFHRRARKRGGAGNQEARHKNAQPQPPHVKLCAVFSVGKSRFRSRFLFLEHRDHRVSAGRSHTGVPSPPLAKHLGVPSPVCGWRAAAIA